MPTQPDQVDRLRPILAELDDAYRHMVSAVAALRDLRRALVELHPGVIDEKGSTEPDE